MSTATQDWVAEAIELQAQGLSERKIAEAVNKAPSTVHAALAKVGDPEPPAPSSNGNGSHVVSSEDAARFAASAERGSVEPIPGQTSIDVPPEDDPEHPDALAAFRGEAGEAVGPMPPREMDGGDVVHVEQIRVDGTTQFAIDFGGKQAQTATVTLSGRGEVNGFYRKGDRIRGSFVAVIVGVAGKDSVDKQTGIVTEATQLHTAKIVDFEVDAA